MVDLYDLLALRKILYLLNAEHSERKMQKDSATFTNIWAYYRDRPSYYAMSLLDCVMAMKNPGEIA